MAFGELAWLFLEPDTALDQCPRILLLCFRARISGGQPTSLLLPSPQSIVSHSLGLLVKELSNLQGGSMGLKHELYLSFLECICFSGLKSVGSSCIFGEGCGRWRGLDGRGATAFSALLLHFFCQRFLSTCIFASRKKLCSRVHSHVRCLTATYV